MLFSPYRSPNWKAHNPSAATTQSNSLFISALRTLACMVPLVSALLVIGGRVADAPDGVRTVIADQQRSVPGYSNANRPSPDVPVIEYKARQEIFVLAAGPVCLVQRYADHLISRTYRSVPWTVLGCKNVAPIFGRELRAFVKRYLERSIVRLQKHVRNERFVFQLRMFAFVARVLVAANVPPSPAIEAAFGDMCDVVGYKIVSQPVTFVDRTPQLAALGMNRQPASSIPDPIRVYTHLGAIGIELQNVGPILFIGRRVGVVDIRCRPD